MNGDARYWIDKLNLQAHPEGGYFAEVYRSGEMLPAAALPERYGQDRNIATAIYFLLTSDQISRFHRLKSDETWHFYTGSPMTIHLLDPNQGYSKLLLGPDFDSGYRFQQTVPRNVWFGATVDQPASFTLVGCTVAPGFDFADFEMGTNEDLKAAFPGYTEVIDRLT